MISRGTIFRLLLTHYNSDIFKPVGNKINHKEPTAAGSIHPCKLYHIFMYPRKPSTNPGSELDHIVAFSREQAAALTDFVRDISLRAKYIMFSRAVP